MASGVETASSRSPSAPTAGALSIWPAMLELDPDGRRQPAPVGRSVMTWKTIGCWWAAPWIAAARGDRRIRLPEEPHQVVDEPARGRTASLPYSSGTSTRSLAGGSRSAPPLEAAERRLERDLGASLGARGLASGEGVAPPRLEGVDEGGERPVPRVGHRSQFPGQR